MATKKTTPKKTTATKGRPPAEARTEDGDLIARAIKRLGCSRGELADRIAKITGRSFFQSRLSSANRVDGKALTEDQRAAIRTLISASNRSA